MNVTIAQWDDWVNVFIDGDSRYMGHSIDYPDLLEILGVPYEMISVQGEDVWELSRITSLNELEEEMHRNDH